MPTTSTIERLWEELRLSGAPLVHRRVDECHPLELYAEYEQPNSPGLLLLCPSCPPESASLGALHVQRSARPDRSWALRIGLAKPELLAVFAALCSDIIGWSRAGITREAAAAAILKRMERWKDLLSGRSQRLSEGVLRGLIGELSVLRQHVLPAFPPQEAIRSWTGPLGTAQDFRLPSGRWIEVKTIDRDSRRVRISSLEQLDGGNHFLDLAVVGVEAAVPGSSGAVNARMLVGEMRDVLAADQTAALELDGRLAAAGWFDTAEHEEPTLRVHAIEFHPVSGDFPRLTPGTVPRGITAAVYWIDLPPPVAGQGADAEETQAQ